MIASLPMYDRPETAAATDRLWDGIRGGLRSLGIGAPERLRRGGDPWDQWMSPDLVFSQTCGLPFAAHLRGRVTLIGLPVFGLPDCPPGQYYSVIIARPGGLPDNPRIAVNEPLSQSGWANLITWLDGRAYDRAVLTGSHRGSARAVAEDRADLAAIDAQSWWLMQRHDAWVADLAVIDRTSPIHGLPFITRVGQDPGPYRAAISEAIASMRSDDAEALNLTGFVPVTPEAYSDRVTPPAP